MASPLIVTVKVAPWLRFYIFGVVVFSALTGTKPDRNKVDYWIKKAVTIKTTGDKKQDTSGVSRNV
jgi:hypothetical protein